MPYGDHWEPGTSTFNNLTLCPCTPQRNIDLDADPPTIEGVPIADPRSRRFSGHALDCSVAPSLLAEQNTGCEVSTYTGGDHCCLHPDFGHRGMFVVDTDRECAMAGARNCTRFLEDLPEVHVFMKAVVTYTDGTLDNTRPLLGFAVTPLQEYDAMECADPPWPCVHTFDYVLPLDFNGVAPDPRSHPWGWNFTHYDVLWTQPHIHSFALSAELQDALTNRTICMCSIENGCLRYGETNNAGDEAGFLTDINPCTFSAGPESAGRLVRSNPVRSIVRYNTTTRRITGAMAMWNFFAVGVPGTELPAAPTMHASASPGHGHAAPP